MEDRGPWSMPHGVWLVPQEWEYMLVDCEYFKGDWRPKFMAGQLLEGWPGGPSLSELLSEVGADRWELATATPGVGFYDKDSDRRNWHLIFKRPKDS